MLRHTDQQSQLINPLSISTPQACRTKCKLTTMLMLVTTTPPVAMEMMSQSISLMASAYQTLAGLLNINVFQETMNVAHNAQKPDTMNMTVQ
jgi:hypothetical protein